MNECHPMDEFSNIFLFAAWQVYWQNFALITQIWKWYQISQRSHVKVRCYTLRVWFLNSRKRKELLVVNHLLMKVRHAQYTLELVCGFLLKKVERQKGAVLNSKVVTILPIIFFLLFLLFVIIYYLFILYFLLPVQQPEFF